jgi:hypothetical protein
MPLVASALEQRSATMEMRPKRPVTHVLLRGLLRTKDEQGETWWLERLPGIASVHRGEARCDLIVGERRKQRVGAT